MSDPILELFKRHSDLDNIVLKRKGSDWEITAIVCERADGENARVKHTYRHGNWVAYWTSSVASSGGSNVFAHEIEENVCSYPAEIQGNIPAAVDAVVRAIRDPETPIETRPENLELNQVELPNVSPADLQVISYYTKKGSVQRLVSVGQSHPLSVILIPSRHSYTATEPSEPSPYPCLSGSSPISPP